MVASSSELLKQGYLKDVDIFQDLSPDEVETLGKRPAADRRSRHDLLLA